MPIRPSVSKTWTLTLAEAFAFGIEQTAIGTAEAIGLQGALQRVATEAAPRGRSACARRAGAEASDASADQRCSLASGVTLDLLARQDRG